MNRLSELMKKAELARHKETWTDENAKALQTLRGIYARHFEAMVEALEAALHLVAETSNGGNFECECGFHLDECPNKDKKCDGQAYQKVRNVLASLEKEME